MLDFYCQSESKLSKAWPIEFSVLVKVTTRLTCLGQPRVHSGVAFKSFDVDSSLSFEMSDALPNALKRTCSSHTKFPRSAASGPQIEVSKKRQLISVTSRDLPDLRITFFSVMRREIGKNCGSIVFRRIEKSVIAISRL